MKIELPRINWGIYGPWDCRSGSKWRGTMCAPSPCIPLFWHRVAIVRRVIIVLKDVGSLGNFWGECCKKSSFTPWLLSAALQWKDHSPGLLIRPILAERLINWIIISITSKHINILMLSSIKSRLHFWDTYTCCSVMVMFGPPLGLVMLCVFIMIQRQTIHCEYE